MLQQEYGKNKKGFYSNDNRFNIGFSSIKFASNYSNEYKIFCILNGRFELKAQVKTEIFESNSSFIYFLIVAQL